MFNVVCCERFPALGNMPKESLLGLRIIRPYSKDNFEDRLVLFFSTGTAKCRR